jgi:hypothetical protein
MGFDGLVLGGIREYLDGLLKWRGSTVMLHGKIGFSKAVRVAIRSQERSGARL